MAGSADSDNHPTDADLVRRTLSGDTSAYEELVRRWAARVLACCHARVGCVHLAEDLAQETLLRGYQALSSLESPDKFGPWLRAIAHHVWLDWRKSKQSSQVPFTALLGGNNSPEFIAQCSSDSTSHLAERADELRQLMSQVESLSQEYREVLFLYYYHDTTYRELAELLGVSTATVNARLTKARALLRKRLSTSLE